MPAPQEYNGHRSWNAWNVSLWIANEEPLYRAALECIKTARQSNARRIERGKPAATEAQIAGAAARLLRTSYIGTRTPDGAKYTQLAVKLAMLELMEE